MIVLEHILRVIIHATKCKAGYGSDVYFSVWYLFPWKTLQNPTVFFIIGYEGVFLLSHNVQNLEAVTGMCNHIFLH